jgi:hypothetical protein
MGTVATRTASGGAAHAAGKCGSASQRRYHLTYGSTVDFYGHARAFALAPFKIANHTMSGKDKKIKRKRLFVDSKVQGSLVRQLITHWVLACFLIFLYLLTLQAFSNGFALGFMENLSVMGQKYGLLAAVMLVISPVFIYDSIKLSNRFVGPMISFRSSLKDLATGKNVEELTFRRGDFWREMTNDLNKVSVELRDLRRRQAPEPDKSDLIEAS